MPTQEKTHKKRGGAGRGQGRKKNSKNIVTIQKAVIVENTLKDIESKVKIRALNIIDAQYNAAIGYHKMIHMYKDSEGMTHAETVRDPKQMQEYLDTGVYGTDYTIVYGAEPDWKAGDALLNRGFGKARESIVHSGGVGVLHLIKTLNSPDGNGGQTED